jgi:glyoxylase-like metal-dependent hydrolase (beta-lactamase superfamily II)
LDKIIILKQYINKIINQGDDSGNEMVVQFCLPSGLEIYGLPTKNFYGGHWDLGPTWNYAVMADRPFLVDAGRFGQGKNLVGMMATAGIRCADLDFVLISHSHEDHDGGLAELVKKTRLKVKAHNIYDFLIRRYPSKAPGGHKQNFPAKCWHCMMPESFWRKNCLEYHRVLHDLVMENINDGQTALGSDIHTLHLPGHSPDCLAVLLGSEVLIVGDIVLPDISPWPTREAMFDEVAEVIAPRYSQAESIFGLQRYLKSLMKLEQIARQYPDLLVLPAHRLYYSGRWNGIRLTDRVGELIQHHIARCAAILEILSSGPKTAEEIAGAHFDEKLLQGFGSLMAANEIAGHCELLIKSGDVTAAENSRYAFTGTTNFERYIQNLESDF